VLLSAVEPSRIAEVAPEGIESREGIVAFVEVILQPVVYVFVGRFLEVRVLFGGPAIVPIGFQTGKR
jgi:hypothetical protein